MQNKYLPNFKPTSRDARALVSLLKEGLDMRKAVFKTADPEELEAVLAGFLVFGKHPFDVVINDLPKAKRLLVKACFDALLGKYLKRVAGKNTVRFESTGPVGRLRFETKQQGTGIRVETKTGVVCLDDSYQFFHVELLGHIKHTPIEVVTLVAPWHHLSIIEGLAESPSRRWYELEELTEPFETPEKTWDSVRDYLIERVRLMGGLVLPYGSSSFLCGSGEKAVSQIDIAFLRLYGRRFLPLAKVRSRYGREHIRPGGWA